MDRQFREFIIGVLIAAGIAMGVNFLRTVYDLERQERQANEQWEFQQQQWEQQRKLQIQELEQRRQELLRQNEQIKSQQNNNSSKDSSGDKYSKWQKGPKLNPPIDEPAYYELHKRANLKNFSGMKAKDIIDLRIKAVKNSKIMAQILPSINDYEPSSSVYNLEDGKQWISAYQIACHGVDNNKNIGRGFSRESIGILNPENLLYLIIPSYSLKNYGIPCSDVDYHIPEGASYDYRTNTITVKIDYSSFYAKHNWYLQMYLADSNARDLGYNYVFADKVTNIKFINQNNFSQDIITTRGYYHTGFACGLPEGCSNYSPHETGYDFRFTALPAEMHVKLWKERPESTSQKADLNYRMIFK